jgi:hypothetical protein
MNMLLFENQESADRRQVVALLEKSISNVRGGNALGPDIGSAIRYAKLAVELMRMIESLTAKRE